MGRHKQPPEYFEARRALNRHLHRHHNGVTGEGMLADRLDQHEEMHLVALRLSVDVGHTHEPCADGEDDVELAWRMLQEGEDQHGLEERGPDITIAMDKASQERRARRKKEGGPQHGQADTAGDARPTEAVANRARQRRR